MLSGKMIERYSDLEAWLHDSLIGKRALNLHAHILKESGLLDVLTEGKARDVLDVGCGGGQSALRLKALFPLSSVLGNRPL